MRIEKLPNDCDLTEPSVAWAAETLGVMPEELVIFCGHNNAAAAQGIKDRYRCKIVFLPNELLVDQDAWAAQYGVDYVWTPGA